MGESTFVSMEMSQQGQGHVQNVRQRVQVKRVVRLLWPTGCTAIDETGLHGYDQPFVQQ